MMSRVSIPILYQTSPGVLRSGQFSGFNRAVLSGGLRYSFGIGFVVFVVPNLSVKWMDPVLILYRTAPLKLVVFVQILKKIALPCGAF